MTNEQMAENKQRFIDLCHQNIKRDGLDKVLSYLKDKTDFFIAPTSTNFHLNENGGLCKHSMNVYDICMDLSEKILTPRIETGEAVFTEPISKESIAICALFHDICKTNIYKPTEKFKKVDGRWVTYPGWEIHDEFPFGHGEKSVIMLNWFISLKKEEMLAIRWHMGMYDMAAHNCPQHYAFNEAVGKHPLVVLLHMADMMASNCVEKTIEY